MKSIQSLALACTAAIVVVVGVAVWRTDQAPSPSPVARAAPGESRTASLEGAAPSTLMPPSLDGATVPALLKTDRAGHLLKTRDVRDVFDFLLIAQHELPPAGLDDLVREQVALQVASPALEECMDLWRRYQAFRQAFVDAERKASTGPADAQAMAGLLRDRVERRRALARQVLADVKDAWFEADERDDLAALERVTTLADPRLAAEDKRAKLASLQASAPVDVALRPEAAQRVRQSASNEQAWQTRYEDYASQRALIAAAGGLPEAEKARQVEQLRRSLFTDDADRGRAWMLDQIQASKR
jgi:lipase chaperone LimK